MSKSSSFSIVVIGAGFSGLAAACVLAQQGYAVKVLEKHDHAGGRARVMHRDGFTFDMGPSWYWMPEVMEQFFQRCGSSASKFFELVQLDPAYQVMFNDGTTMEIPANLGSLKALVESEEPGASAQLESFLADAQIKYEKGMGEFVFKPGLSIFEFADPKLIRSAFQLNLFSSFSKHVRKYFTSPKLIRLLEFPVLFLGAMPKHIPALYSMMNYADLKLGTWYPMGGFGKLADGMYQLAKQLGVEFHFQTEVEAFQFDSGKIVAVKTLQHQFDVDLVVSSADYHFTEQKLLPASYRNYSKKYWDTRTMSPSCLLFYVGVNKKISRLKHHNLFFDSDFEAHAKAIYEKPDYPEKPLFYVCCPSKTDPSVAPDGMENLFLLIPLAPGLHDTPEIRKHFFTQLVRRLETYCGERIEEHIISYLDYSVKDFETDYHAFKGNAYGLANTLKQTAILKPQIRNKKIKNLYYTGQLTVPGPGVPPSIISGQLVADYIIQSHKNS